MRTNSKVKIKLLVPDKDGVYHDFDKDLTEMQRQNYQNKITSIFVEGYREKIKRKSSR